MIIQKKARIETATFGGGCFWCTEAIFDSLKGVISVASGYAGGTTPHPTYEAICTGTTGHAEVIRIEYDSNIINFETLLSVFFDTHNPTTLNRQGADIGTQYRSVIFYHNAKQKVIAEQFIADLTKEKVFDDPIVTEITEINNYYEAENYHQDYFENNKNKGYCRMVINPKLDHFIKNHSNLLK